MLENYFETASTLTRLRSGPTGPFLDDFARALHASGYSRWTARGFLRAAAHLGTWMQAEALNIGELDGDVLSDFAAHLPACRCLRRNRGIYGDAVRGAQLFVEHLTDHAVLPRTTQPVIETIPDAVAQFEHWMLHHRGVTASTLAVYRPILLELHDRLQDANSFTASNLRQFVSTRAARHGRSTAKTVVKAVRMYVRYAVARGLCAPHLAEAIPTIAEWRLSTLPVYISPLDVERIIAATEASATSGLRDRAILLLLARLGLRAGDITAMLLDDIDWEAGTLLVAGKDRRATRLPLPQDAGDALLAYLAEGRPDTLDRHVFIRSRAPVGRLQTSAAVSYVVNRAAERAEVRMPRGGAHVLRHSVATALVRGGMPLSAVGIVLRHRSEQTTAHYAKVDLPSLRRIAQPWPSEVSSC